MRLLLQSGDFLVIINIFYRIWLSLRCMSLFLFLYTRLGVLVNLFIWSLGSWCVYAAATVDRYLSTINEQLALDAAQQDAKKLEEAFAAADSFARRLEKQLNKRPFICGQTLVLLTATTHSDSIVHLLGVLSVFGTAALGHLLLLACQMWFFVQLCSSWQAFSWHSSSRGPSVVVEFIEFQTACPPAVACCSFLPRFRLTTFYLVSRFLSSISVFMLTLR